MCPFIPNIAQNSIISNEQYTEESDEGHLFKGYSEDEATLYLDQHEGDVSVTCQRSPLQCFWRKDKKNVL
ncbi:20234_t:CDS:1, partial [Racocetra persica]